MLLPKQEHEDKDTSLKTKTILKIIVLLQYSLMAAIFIPTQLNAFGIINYQTNIEIEKRKLLICLKKQKKIYKQK